MSKLTLEQMKNLPESEQEALFNRISTIRKQMKPVNYGSVYGIGKVKLARETGWTQKVAQDMLDEYWKRNWAVKECVKHLETKTVGGHTWLLNPVSKFWYQLRYDKDRFSTLNQGTGVFLFDSWVARVRARGIKICGQFHDEIIFWTLQEDTDRKKLKDAIRDLNDSLELNVKLDIDVKFGANYSDVH